MIFLSAKIKVTDATLFHVFFGQIDVVMMMVMIFWTSICAAVFAY
jgi:hypothetical protein